MTVPMRFESNLFEGICKSSSTSSFNQVSPRKEGISPTKRLNKFSDQFGGGL